MRGVKILLQPAFQDLYWKLNERYKILQGKQDEWGECTTRLDFSSQFLKAPCLDVYGFFYSWLIWPPVEEKAASPNDNFFH